MEINPKTRCVKFRQYSAQGTHIKQLVQPLCSEDESDPDQENDEMFNQVLSEENGDDYEGDSDFEEKSSVDSDDVVVVDDDVSNADKNDDDDDDDDYDSGDTTSHYITKPLIVNGYSIQPGLPKEFVSVLNNIRPSFSVPAHINLLIEMIVNGDIAFGESGLIAKPDLEALYGRRPSSVTTKFCH